MAFEKVAQLSDIGDEETLAIEGEPKVVLYRVGDDVFATQFFCTHEDAPMDEAWVNDDCTIDCPWHAAKFCLRTGEVLSPPANEPLKTFPVKIDGEDIFIDRGLS